MIVNRYRALTLGCVVLAAPLAGAQVFRGGITAVVLDVVVTNDHGDAIAGLTATDFTVNEDGQTRPIISAVFVSLPRQGNPSLIEPGRVFALNELPRDRRTFIFVLDDLDTAPSDTMRARDAAKRFITQMPDGDLAAMVYTGQQRGSMAFTTDKRSMLETVSHFTGMRPMENGIGAAMVGELQIRNYLRVLETLKNAATWLADIEGRRKAVVLITGAVPPAMTRSNTQVADRLRQVTTASMKANVAIYPIDVRGLVAPHDDMGGFDDGPIGPRREASPISLMALAHETGGLLVNNTNNLAAGFDRIVRDQSSYYLVAYTPAHDDPKSRRYRVDVKTRQRGATVRARLGYVSGQ